MKKFFTTLSASLIAISLGVLFAPQMTEAISTADKYKLNNQMGPVARAVQLGTLIENAENSLGVLANGETISNGTDDTVTVGSDDNDTTLQVLGFEAKAAKLQLWADQGDDAGDKFSIEVDTGGAFTIYQNATALAALSSAGDWTFSGTTPYLTIGDAGAEDAGLLFDGNAQDFNISLDDSEDKLVIGLGAAAGTTNRMAFNSADLNIVLGDASAADVGFIFDGNAQDFNISLDDSTDDLVIGLGSVAGTTDAIRIDENQVVTFVQDPILAGTTPHLTVGDGGAEDAGIIWDGHSGGFDWYMTNDDSADKLVIGLGSTAPTTSRMTFNSANLNVILGDATAADVSLVWDGNAQDYHIGLDDSTDDLVIGLGSTPGTTDAIRIDENQVVTFVKNPIFAGSSTFFTFGDGDAEDTGIVFDGNAQNFNIGLDDSTDDLVIGLGTTPGTTDAIRIDENQVVTFVQDPVLIGTTPLLTIGDAGEEDAAVKFDGNAQDFIIGLDDSVDKLVIALGSALGTTNRLAFNSADLNIVVGDASAADVGFVFDGNAQDFNISLDDSTDDLVIGLGSAAGTTDALRIDENQVVTFVQDPVFIGTTPYLTIGDAGAEDAGLVFDGNAQDFNISLDDSTDDLVIGLGSAAGTTDAIRIDENQDVTFVQNVVGLGTDSLSGFLQKQVASTTASLTAVQCGSTIVSNSADVMTLPEASTVLGCRYTFVCGTADDLDINPADGTDQIGKVVSVTGTNTTTVLSSLAAGDAIRCTDIGSSIMLEAVGNDLWVSVGAANGTWTDID